ncbi:tail fiber protein [Edwardsiella ictaluri]|uniref:tail fiber protein n=2 Tax=Edwardsiella ictaluri TaxID=67780 RepID=UPI000E0019D0|nr:tail fiber protein [Edwardsiella ictaluri]EKS7807547.1 tail fiber protein [Edwardsiella ictaluri]UCQ49759.1 tail fiber protein [Edwardsiella ictaluri]STP81138.1 Tail fiber protein [Edwardsiella ictaluri]
MSTVITQHYQQWCASQMSHDLPARPDTVIFAYIPGQDENAEIDHTEPLPADTFIRHRMPVMQYGLLNPNVVAFSVILDTTVGNFDYNWIGLLHAESNTLCMISHVPRQQKIKTADGIQGNNLTRTFAMEFDGAAAAMQVTVTAEVWQIDFTARLAGMDEIRRLIARDHYGPAAFLDDGWRVTPQEGAAHIAPGIGYVQGLRVVLPSATTLPVQPGQTIWLDASWQGTATGAWQTAIQLFADNRQAIDDYTDAAGFCHYLAPLATVATDGATDLRPATPGDRQQDALRAHEASRNHPTATLDEVGFVRLNDSTDSDSTTQAATPNAVKRTYEEATRAASTSQAGQVLLEDSISSYSTTNAATANAVRYAYENAVRPATTSQAGQVLLEDSVSSTSTTNAPTANAVRYAYENAVRPATTSQAGQVLLEDSVSSTSTTNAPTSSALKRTYDRANSAYDRANSAYDRASSAYSYAGSIYDKAYDAYDIARRAPPVGTPQPWPNTSIPSGWIKCAGQSFSTSSYPELAKAYPNGRLPDLRGEFIRGYDDYGGTDSQRQILSWQGDAMRNITGTFGVDDQTIEQVTGVFREYGRFSYDARSERNGAGRIIYFDASQVVPTANENRPRNIAFLYIVRAQ